MIDLLLGYTLQFLAHFAIGAAVILAVTLLLRWAVNRWYRPGINLAGWALGLGTAFVWLTVALSALITGAQVGSIAVLTRLVETDGLVWAENAVMLAAKPVGIESAEQRFGPAELEALAEQLSPGIGARVRAEVDAQQMVEKVDAQWQRLPEFIREQALQRAPKTQWSVRDLVQLGYRQLVAPTVTASRIQGLIFAYGLGVILIVFAQLCDLLLRWWSRRPASPNP